MNVHPSQKKKEKRGTHSTVSHIDCCSGGPVAIDRHTDFQHRRRQQAVHPQAHFSMHSLIVNAIVAQL